MYSQPILWQKLEENKWVGRIIFVITFLLFCLAFRRYILDSTKILTTSQIAMSDFEAYLYAARAITLNENLYTYNQQVGVFPYEYPPTLAILLVPLAYLSPLAAQRIWLLANQLLLGGALFLSLNVINQRLSNWKLLLLGCIIFGFYPLYTNLKLGQVGVILYFLVALTFWLWHKRRRVLAGLCLGLAGAIKVIPLGLVVYFLWKREYRVALYTMLFSLVIQLVPDLVFGTVWLASYIEAFPSFYQIENPLYFGNQSFYGFFARFFFETMGGVSSRETALITRVLAFISGAIVFACTIVLSQRDKKASHTEVEILEIGGILIAIVLLNPISWHHHFVWLLFISPSLIYHLSEQIRLDSSFRGFTLVILSLVAFALLSQPFRLPRILGYEISDQGLLATLLKSLVFYGTLLIWGVVISLLHTFRKQGEIEL